MLERIKAAVDAVERERVARKLLKQCADVWDPSRYEWEVEASDWGVKLSTPIWRVSEDGTLVPDTYRRMIYSTDTGMFYTTATSAMSPGVYTDVRMDHGEFYDTATHDWRTHNIDMPVW